MLRPNSILYHCNDSTCCQKFLQDHTYVIESQEDGIWLGSGMYFWDNATNANYWLKQKSRKQPEEKFEIVIAHVYMDHMLDLTDIDICKNIETLWKTYKQKSGLDTPDNETLGYKLNTLYDYFPSFKEMYHVIKILGKYNYSPPNKLFEYNIRNNNTEPITSVKCIYNVKNISAIADRTIYKGDDVKHD